MSQIQWCNAAVPNLWVATPSGVAIDFHWGRHWSLDIYKIHAQLHIHNVRTCLCQKLCYVKCSPSKTGFNKIKASSILELVENYSKLLSSMLHWLHMCYTILSYTDRNITIHSNFVCCIFCISISGVAVLCEKNAGVARCRRLGIAGVTHRVWRSVTLYCEARALG